MYACMSLGSCDKWRWGNENEDMTSPEHRRGEGLYCRYEAEYSQRHLEESRLNQARRGERWGWGVRAKRPRMSQERSCIAEMLGLDRTEMLDEGESSPWDGWVWSRGQGETR